MHGWNDAGVLYVASMRDSYVEEAAVAARGVRERYPSLPIVLFTDRPEHRACVNGVFDRVEAIEPWPGRTTPWAEGQLNRIRSLPRTPFQRTLHLDTDTHLLSPDLPSLFARLDDGEVGMVETTEDDSYARYHLGRRMFNTGVILYRRTTSVERWLAEWAARSERNFRMVARVRLTPLPFLEHVADEGVRRRLLSNDQVSLTEMLSPDTNTLGVTLVPLEPTWNHRCAEPHDASGRLAHIWHPPRAVPPASDARTTGAPQAVAEMPQQ
jgi:hypothetical protein